MVATTLSRVEEKIVLVGPLFPKHVDFGAAGVTLDWHRRTASARYAGPFVSWSAVRDADFSTAPPEIRLRDGRTLFISAELRDAFKDALWSAGVPIVRRPDAWGRLLEPFLDTDYDIVRERFEDELRSWGFDEKETAAIRRRVRIPMAAMTLATWEWCGYGQSDLLMASYSVRPTPRLATWWGYNRFRAWTDAIADRPALAGTR